MFRVEGLRCQPPDDIRVSYPRNPDYQEGVEGLGFFYKDLHPKVSGVGLLIDRSS